MTELLKILGLMFLSGIKFFFAPSTTYLAGYSFIETLAITISGGVLGILVFFYFGEFLKYLFSGIRFRKKEKLVFTKSSRRIVSIKEKYGLIGLVILTPILLSIPLGSLLAAKYFDHDKRTIPFLIISVVLWSLLLTSITALFGKVI